MHYLTDNWKSDLHKLAIGGAWVFIAGSVFALFWLAVQGGNDMWVFGATVGSQTYRAPLLDFSGFLGKVLLVVELLGAVTATVLSCMPWQRPRRIGHTMLIGWSSLWTLGGLRMVMVAPIPLFILSLLAMLAFLGCTAYRALRGWNPPAVPETLRVETMPIDEPRERFDPPPVKEPTTRDHLQRWVNYVGDHARAAYAYAAPKAKSVYESARKSIRSMTKSA